jgi:ATP-dependent Lhr-like helicase
LRLAIVCIERLARIAGRDLQRIGLSATVGNPDRLLTWLQGSPAGTRKGAVVGGSPHSFGMTQAALPAADLQPRATPA